MVAIATELDALLNDGTSVGSLVRNDARTVSARVYSDPEVYRLELERIFDRAWLMICHESEIPNPGDFVMRTMGEDRVIVTRDASGQINILLNSCSHKGTQVCRAEQGSTPTFSCPYHGWVYRNTGELMQVPAEKEAFKDALDKPNLGLKRARMGIYQGFVFGTWNESGISLEEHLGDVRWYLDMVFGALDNGMEVAGPPVRWVVDANWKIAAGDNFSGDAYHITTTHRSFQEIGMAPMGSGTADTRLSGLSVCDPVHGHGLRCTGAVYIEGGEPSIEHVCTSVGIPIDRIDEMRRRLSAEQIECFTKAPPRVGNVFPNFSWTNAPFPTEHGGAVEPLTSVRTWQPRGPNHMEVLTWPMVYKDAPPETKAAARRCVIRTFNSSGIFESDDAEMWSAIQRSLAGVQGRRRELLYKATSEPDSTEWPGPLDARPGFATEDNLWNFYLTWQRWMRAA